MKKKPTLSLNTTQAIKYALCQIPGQTIHARDIIDAVKVVCPKAKYPTVRRLLALGTEVKNIGALPCTRVGDGEYKVHSAAKCKPFNPVSTFAGASLFD
mgnify:FL=1